MKNYKEQLSIKLKGRYSLEQFSEKPAEVSDITCNLPLLCAVFLQARG